MITVKETYTKLLIGFRVCACLLLITSLLLTACDKTEPLPPKQKIQQPATVPPVTLSQKANVTSLWQKLDSVVDTNLENSALLQQQVLRFLYSPQTNHLHAAQKSWLETRASYESLFFYTLLYSVAPNSSSGELNWHRQLGAWPIQPGMLDRFGTYKFSGLVFNVGVPLNQESLLSMHQATESDEVIVGLYAMEYILFGGDSPRSFDEFGRRTQLGAVEKEAGFETPDELPTQRRRQLLELQAELITTKMTEAAHFWGSTKTHSTLSNLTEQDITNSCIVFVAEHLITLSEMESKSPWEQKQTLQRMYAQLTGWAVLLPEITWLKVDLLQPLINSELDQLRQIIEALQNSPAEQTITLKQRKPLYQNLNKIAQILKSSSIGAAPSDAANENKEPASSTSKAPTEPDGSQQL